MAAKAPEEPRLQSGDDSRPAEQRGLPAKIGEHVCELEEFRRALSDDRSVKSCTSSKSAKRMRLQAELEAAKKLMEQNKKLVELELAFKHAEIDELEAAMKSESGSTIGPLGFGLAYPIKTEPLSPAGRRVEEALNAQDRLANVAVDVKKIKQEVEDPVAMLNYGVSRVAGVNAVLSGLHGGRDDCLDGGLENIRAPVDHANFPPQLSTSEHAQSVKLERQLQQQQREFNVRERAYQEALFRAKQQPQQQTPQLDVKQRRATPAETLGRNPQAKLADNGVSPARIPAPETSMNKLAEAIVAAISNASNTTANPPHKNRQNTGNSNDDVNMRRYAARQSMSRDLPAFSGDAEDWPTFISMFRLTTKECGFSDAENMIRLQRCLKGKAKETVFSLLAVTENLDKVIKMLEARFGRPDNIIQAMIQKAKERPFRQGRRLDHTRGFGKCSGKPGNHYGVTEIHRPHAQPPAKTGASGETARWSAFVVG